MSLGKAPTNPLPPHYRPAGGDAYQVKDGDSWITVAQSLGMDPWDLIQFNFQTRDPDEVNWYLHRNVGCTRISPDGFNYQFSSHDRPGTIFLPISRLNFDSEIIEVDGPKKTKGPQPQRGWQMSTQEYNADIQVLEVKPKAPTPDWPVKVGYRLVISLRGRVSFPKNAVSDSAPREGDIKDSYKTRFQRGQKPAWQIEFESKLQSEYGTIKPKLALNASKKEWSKLGAEIGWDGFPLSFEASLNLKEFRLDRDRLVSIAAKVVAVGDKNGIFLRNRDLQLGPFIFSGSVVVQFYFDLAPNMTSRQMLIAMRKLAERALTYGWEGLTVETVAIGGGAVAGATVVSVAGLAAIHREHTRGALDSLNIAYVTGYSKMLSDLTVGTVVPSNEKVLLGVDWKNDLERQRGVIANHWSDGIWLNAMRQCERDGRAAALQQVVVLAVTGQPSQWQTARQRLQQRYGNREHELKQRYFQELYSDLEHGNPFPRIPVY